MLGKLTWEVRAHGDWGDGMLRNKVGIKKMMAAGELGAFISHVRYSALAAR
jgi:hypothetical protein